MSTPAERLLAAQARAHAAQFAPRQERAALTIVTVQRDSLGNPVAAHGTIRGEGDFTMPAGGLVLEAGQVVEVGYPVGAEAGAPLEYLRHLSSDYPGTGAISAFNPVPPPEFDAVPFTADIKGSDTTVVVHVTAWFKPVAAKEQPSGYIVSHRFTAPGQTRTDWTDQGPVPPLTDNPFPVALATPFPPGSTVDVKARTLTSRAAVPSEEGEVESFICPADTASPGTPAGFTADNSVAGELKLVALVATLDPARFSGVRWEVANSSGGAGLITATVSGEYHHRGSAGPKWIALRFAAKNGTLGPRYPGSTGFTASPVDLLPAAAPLDTTAPPVWAAPTLALRENLLADGTRQVYLKVTFQAHAYPADYAETVVRLYNGTTYDEWHVAYTGVAHDPVERLVDYGTWVVALRGVDRATNISAVGPTASATLTPQGIPAMGTITSVEQVGLAIRLWFIMGAGGNTFQIQRATNNTGTTGLTTVWDGLGTSFLDLFTDAAVPLTTYWYRYRTRNNNGDSAFSAAVGSTPGWLAATVQPISGTFIGANTIQGNRVIAGTLDAQAIQTNSILSALIKTAASGARWELEGHTAGGNQDQLRLYDAGGVLRVSLRGDALILWQDTGNLRAVYDGSGIFIYRDGTNLARALFNTTGVHLRRDDGVTERVTLDNSGLSVWNDAGTVASFFLKPAGSQLLTNDGVLALGDSGYGLLSFGRVNTGGLTKTTGVQVQNSAGLIFHLATAQDGTPADWFSLRGDGRIGWGNGANFAGAFDSFDGTNRNFSVPIRSVVGGAAVKLTHIGTSSSATLDWSHGALWLGLNSNPSAQVNVGNGAGSYGPILASAFTVASDEVFKRNIRDLGGALPLLRALRPRRYRRAGDPASARDEFGFIAGEVEAVAPNAVTTLAPIPVLPAVPGDPLPDPLPAAKGLSVTTLLAVIVRGVQEYLDANDAALAALSARVAALEAGG